MIHFSIYKKIVFPCRSFVKLLNKILISPSPYRYGILYSVHILKTHFNVIPDQSMSVVSSAISILQTARHAIRGKTKQLGMQFEEKPNNQACNSRKNQTTRHAVRGKTKKLGMQFEEKPNQACSSRKTRSFERNTSNNKSRML